jgi:hypothetical protein
MELRPTKPIVVFNRVLNAEFEPGRFEFKVILQALIAIGEGISVNP